MANAFLADADREKAKAQKEKTPVYENDLEFAFLAKPGETQSNVRILSHERSESIRG